MEEKDYTKREHDIIFSEIRESLSRIEKQVGLTNGRVTNLELWRAGTVGKFTIISIIVGTFVTGIITFVINHNPFTK